MNLRNGWIDKHLYFIFQIQGFYFVQCPLYSVQCTVYSVQCTVYCVQCTGTMYSVQCTMYSEQCTVYSVQCTMYSLSLQSLQLKSVYQLKTRDQKPSFIIGRRNFCFCDNELLKCCVPKTNLGFFHEFMFTDNFVDFSVFYVHCTLCSIQYTIWHELCISTHCTHYIIFSTLNRAQYQCQE